MTIKQGIQNWVDSALDTKDEIAEELLTLGVDPKIALKASSNLTKKAISERLEHHFRNKSAAEITSTISKHSKSNPLS